MNSNAGLRQNELLRVVAFILAVLHVVRISALGGSVGNPFYVAAARATIAVDDLRAARHF